MPVVCLWHDLKKHLLAALDSGRLGGRQPGPEAMQGRCLPTAAMCQCCPPDTPLHLQEVPRDGPGVPDFEVSMKGQQGAALQAQEPLCAWFKLAHT